MDKFKRIRDWLFEEYDEFPVWMRLVVNLLGFGIGWALADIFIFMTTGR